MLAPHATGGSQRESSWQMWPLPTSAANGQVGSTGHQARERTVTQQHWRIWSQSREWEIKWPVIRRSYAVRDGVAAGAFALDRTYLLDLLLEAYPRLASLFEPGCAIRLERAADPDVADRRYFLVTAMTSLPVGEALARMDRFADEWWLSHIARAGRDLVFVVDFA